MIDLLPDDIPTEAGPRLSKLTVRHLLTITTGHAGDTLQLADAAFGPFCLSTTR